MLVANLRMLNGIVEVRSSTVDRALARTCQPAVRHEDRPPPDPLAVLADDSGKPHLDDVVIDLAGSPCAGLCEAEPRAQIMRLRK